MTILVSKDLKESVLWKVFLEKGILTDLGEPLLTKESVSLERVVKLKETIIQSKSYRIFQTHTISMFTKQTYELFEGAIREGELYGAEYADVNLRLKQFIYCSPFFVPHKLKRIYLQAPVTFYALKE